MVRLELGLRLHDGKIVNKANRELTEVRKRASGVRFRKLRVIWCIFKTLRVYSEFVNLSGVFGEKTLIIIIIIIIITKNNSITQVINL